MYIYIIIYNCTVTLTQVVGVVNNRGFFGWQVVLRDLRFAGCGVTDTVGDHPGVPERRVSVVISMHSDTPGLDFVAQVSTAVCVCVYTWCFLGTASRLTVKSKRCLATMKSGRGRASGVSELRVRYTSGWDVDSTIGLQGQEGIPRQSSVCRFSRNPLRVSNILVSHE